MCITDGIIPYSAAVYSRTFSIVPIFFCFISFVLHCIALHLFYPLLKSMMYFFFSILDIFILLKNACDACEDVAKIGEHIFSKSIEKKKKKKPEMAADIVLCLHSM